MIKEDIEKIIKIIDDNYYFWNNCEQWKKIKNIMHSMEKEMLSFYNVRKLIVGMNDHHLAIKYVNHKTIVPFYLDEKENGIFKKDYFNNKIYSINGELVENIISMYRSDYSKQYINYLNDDIKNGYFLLNDEMHVKYNDGTDEIIKKMDVSEAIKKFGLRDICKKNIFYRKIDHDTFIVKIPFIINEFMLTEMQRVMASNEFQDSSKIIIDLRDNGGGRIDLAKEMVELCFEGRYEFPYLISDALGTKKIIVANGKNMINLNNKHIYIFVNSNTMSAAEFIIVTALKNIFSDRVIIVGKATAGLSDIATETMINDHISLMYTKYRLIDKNNMKKKFDCTIYPNSTEISNWDKELMGIWKIYKGENFDARS